MNYTRTSLWGVAVAAALSWMAPAATADTIVRVSSFEYNATGQLTKETIEPDSANDCLQTSYGYDGYGNRTSASASACAGATGYTISSAGSARTNASSFGTDGRFPVSSTNALSQSETKVFDAKLGTLTSLTGPNGLTTSWTYDGFARKTRETRADGTYTTWAYKLCSESGANCPGSIGAATVIWVAVEQSYAVNASVSAPEKRQFFDILNRPVRVQTQGFDGVTTAPTLVQDTEYNALSLVVRKSNLYALSGGTPVWSSYLYDALGRVTQESVPDPAASGGVATSTFTHNGLTSTATNAKGQTRTVVKNTQGKITQVTDAQSNVITYAYDAIGLLTQTNAAGSITTLSYNKRGQKIAMVDPAMGAWEYRYNAFGELVWQRDSLNQSATMAYDVLGRMTQRTEADLVSQWSYDKKFDNSTCGKGVGKLCEAKADNGYNRTHNYDTLGRASSTATVLDNPGAPATVSETFDANTGRVATKTWPTGYQASYSYTALGYLKTVAGGGTGGFTQTVSYDVLAMNAQGQITQYKTGNQVTTVKNYDATTNRLMGQTATRDGQASGNVLNQSYTYDTLGNLATRADSTTGVGTSESFSYDSLNRLTLATILGGGVSPPQATEVMYDARGNITYKSDVGRYWYDPARPNRMTNVTLETAPGAQITLTGTRALSYAFDDLKPGAQPVGGITVGNGNLEYTVSQDTVNSRHTVRSETYTSFGMPSQMVYGNFVTSTSSTADRTLSFVYGPEHQRIKQTVALSGNGTSSYSAGTTWYLNGIDSLGLSYEKEVKANGITENKHYVSAGGVTFALFVSRTGTLGTQTATVTSYFQHDHLGSITVVTNESGAVTERMAYDPWGKRRNTNGISDVLDSIVGVSTDRGYTMHEHLDEIGIIHMNGRVYDPLIGRFMSADPHVQTISDLQAFNRYMYVMGNPLAFTDPTGYFKFKKLFKAIVAIAVAVFAPEIAAAVGWTAPTVGAAAGTAASVGGLAGSIGITNVAVANGILGGALAGAVSTGTVKGALIGAATGGALGAVGTMAPSGVENVVGHAVVGCAGAAASGGSCAQGAIAGAAGSALSQVSGDLLPKDFSSKTSEVVTNVAAHAVVGGTASVIAGGKFDAGATTAVAGYLFNCLAHQCNGADYGSEKKGFHEYGPMEQQLCNESQGGCMAAARQQLMCNSAPGQGACGSPGQIVGNNLSGGNPVTQYAVNPDVIINGTSPGHVFHDGYVVRWLSVNDAGSVSVWTYGRGNNANLATQIGNQMGGNLIFLNKGMENRRIIQKAIGE